MEAPILSLVLPIYNEEAIIPELDRRLRAFLADVGSERRRFLGGHLRQRRVEGSVARAAEGPRRRRAPLQGAVALPQLRASDGDHRGPGSRERRRRGGDGRRPAGSARGGPPDGRASGAKGTTSCSASARGGTARPRSSGSPPPLYYRLLRAMLGGAPIPRRRRRLPVDEPPRRADAARPARAAPVRARPGLLGRLQADRRHLRTAGALRGRDEVSRSARCSASRSTASRPSRRCRCGSPPGSACWPGLTGAGRRRWAAVVKLFGGVVRGWTTIMILVGLGSSAQLLMTGILGEYVGRIYEEVKRRPLYVVGARSTWARR